ncbi:MAG: alpha-glucosidase, partial [Terriglobia bacterium]
MATGIALIAAACCAVAQQKGSSLQPNGVSAGQNRIVVTRGHTTIMLQPYAANIIRVSISTLKASALAPPGYGVIASPDAQGWQAQHT